MVFITQLVKKQKQAEAEAQAAQAIVLQEQINQHTANAMLILEPFANDFAPYMTTQDYITDKSGLRKLFWAVDAPDFHLWISYNVHTGQAGQPIDDGAVYFCHNYPSDGFGVKQIRLTYTDDGQQPNQAIVEFLCEAIDKKAHWMAEEAKKEAKRLNEAIWEAENGFKYGAHWMNRTKARRKYDKLMELNPDNSPKWQTMYDDWLERRAKYEAEEAAKALIEAENLTNQANFKHAFLHWETDRLTILKANREILSSYQKTYHNGVIQLWCLRYAYLDEDEQVYTDSCYTLHHLPNADGFWQTVSIAGSVIRRKYFNHISIEGPFVKFVTDGNYAGRLKIELADEYLYFDPIKDQQSIADHFAQRVTNLRPLPPEPSPESFGLGELSYWDIQRILGR